MTEIRDRVKAGLIEKLETRGSASLGELKDSVAYRDRGFFGEALGEMLKTGDYLCSRGRIIPLGKSKVFS